MREEVKVNTKLQPTSEQLRLAQITQGEERSLNSSASKNYEHLPYISVSDLFSYGVQTPYLSFLLDADPDYGLLRIRIW